MVGFCRHLVYFLEYDIILLISKNINKVFLINFYENNKKK